MVFRNSKMKEKYFSQKYNTFIVIKFIKDCRSFEKKLYKNFILGFIKKQSVWSISSKSPFIHTKSYG